MGLGFGRMGAKGGFDDLGAGGASSLPGWVPNHSNPPDFAINWSINQVWQKSVTGLVTPDTFGVATSRAAVKWVVDSQGNWSQVSTGVTARSDLGRSTEEARTNLFLNSQAPVTQTVTVVSTSTYAVSVVGAGSLTLSGALTGTVTQGSPVIGVAGSTSLVVTTSGVTGTFVNVQVELGGSVTSPIVTTGSSATRAADVTVLTVSPGSTYTLYSQIIPQCPVGFASDQVILSLDTASLTNRAYMSRRFSNGLANFGSISGNASQWSVVSGTPVLTQNVQGKIAAAYAAGTQNGAANSTAATAGSGASQPVSPTKIHFGCSAASAQFLNGLAIVDAAWLSQALSLADLKAITT